MTVDDDIDDLVIDFGPIQRPITEERIREMVEWSPRRMKLAVDWQDALHPPGSSGENWSPRPPVSGNLSRTAFQAMCGGLTTTLTLAKTVAASSS